MRSHKKKRMVESVRQAIRTVKLTAKFKLNGVIDETLFETYKAIVNELLDYAHSKGIRAWWL